MHNPGEMNSERHYFALIGDIIDSRHEQDRYDVQKKLQSILSSVNAEHAAHIAADFLITLGDEFQGLLFAENRGRAYSRILLDAGGAECSECERNARRKELETGVNTVLLLLSALRRERTKRQNEAAAMYVRNAVTNAAQTQTELAKRLGITQSTFNISLSVSNAREYAEGLIAAEALLSELKTDGEHAENGDKECADKTVLT